MKEKVKCKKCGLFIDSDCETCPYCGYPQKEDASETENKNIESLNEAQDTQSVLDSNSNLNQEAQKRQKDSKVHFFDFESRVMNIKLSKSIMLFVAGFFVLNIIALIFQYIALGSDNWYFIASGNVNGAVNFAVYFMVFGIMFIILMNDSLNFFKEFKKKESWIYGVAFGFLLMLASSAVTSLMQLFQQTGVNQNEAAIDSTTNLFPFLSILVFGIIGPICEEFTYRVGLFSLIKRYNRVLAYLITALFFGFIHFTFSPETIVNELINLPSYVVAGLLLCYFYDYKGIGASTVAHVTNNLFALIMQLLMSSLA